MRVLKEYKQTKGKKAALKRFSKTEGFVQEDKAAEKVVVSVYL